MIPKVINEIGHCLGCGYDLRGITACTCPECGRAFDPADIRTLRTVGVGSPGRLARWLMRPPGVVFSMLTAVVCLHMLWRARMPGSDVLIEGAAVLLVCAARLMAWYLANQHFPKHRADRIAWHRLAIPPLLVLVAMEAAQITFQLAMAISRPAMENMAQDAMDGENQQRPYRDKGWAGVYYIDGVVFDRPLFYAGRTEGTGQLMCRQANSVYIIEDMKAGKLPQQHGKSYWQSGLWIRMSVE